MPELPEVETIARKLKVTVLNKQITGVQVMWRKTIHTHAPGEFTRSLVGTRIKNVRRRGKYIIIDLDNGKKMLIHLRMSGKFVWRRTRDRIEQGRHTRVHISLGDGSELYFQDQRKFGRFYLTEDETSVTGHLGPE
ncbi:MAG: DNA-formamidopyrimidine glycosylase, partial [Anaerolineae bacterium]|nr:DNA-formamidopyrimidine glycosylase [Anaerolineae bacterium]